MNSVRKTSPGRGAQEKEAAPLSLDYDHLWRLCLKHWKWLAGGVLAGFLLGFLYAVSQISIYEAKATILVPAKDPNAAGSDDVGQQDVTSGDMIKTFEQLLQTRDLPERVVRGEHLNENPEFLPDGMTSVSEDTATTMLAEDITVHIRPFTRLIDITVDHHSPKMAEFLANRLAQESILQDFEQRTGGSSTYSDQLQKEVVRLRQKLLESKRALQEYQSAHNMGGTIDDPEDVGDLRLKDLNQQYINAQTQVTLLQERYGPEHPKLIQAKQLMEELRDEVSKAQEDAMTTSGKNIEYSTLKSEVEEDQAQLDTTSKELDTIQSSAHVEISGISVAQEAEAYGPVRPKKIELVAMGGFVGLICGLGFITGLYFIDTSLRTVSQAESALSLPVIAAIPILPESDGRSILPTYSDPQSFVAESFRGLRASLILHDRENPLKTVLVVSAIPGEGKSFCGANLAVAFAQAGLKTLLIDADLRLPTLHTYFNLPANEMKNGFPDILAGHATLASAVVPSPISTLELLLTTAAVDSPAELLSGIRLPRLMDEVAGKYDRIVIDSAPLNAVSDTMLIMPKADAILLVIRAAQTPVSECKSALQKIYSSKMKPLGLILNYLAPHTLKSYAYGYSYGQKPKEKYAK